jgi:hypothetical protein
MFSLYVPSNDVTGERLLPHWLVAGEKITHKTTTTVCVSYGVRSQAVDTVKDGEECLISQCGETHVSRATQRTQ